jgi:hypothetical protein
MDGFFPEVGGGGGGMFAPPPPLSPPPVVLYDSGESPWLSVDGAADLAQVPSVAASHSWLLGELVRRVQRVTELVVVGMPAAGSAGAVVEQPRVAVLIEGLVV